jgi:hypothetical protein
MSRPGSRVEEVHHQDYLLVDTSLTCRIDDTHALVADLNAAVEAEEAARAVVA